MFKPYSLYMSLGTLPFIGMCFLVLFGKDDLNIKFIQAFNAYGFMIFSFMLGSYWGLLVDKKDNTSQHWYFLISNSLAVLAWILYLFLNNLYWSLFLVSGFILLVLIDYNMLKNSIIPEHYFKQRCIITFIVCISIIIVGHTL